MIRKLKKLALPLLMLAAYSSTAGAVDVIIEQDKCIYTSPDGSYTLEFRVENTSYEEETGRYNKIGSLSNVISTTQSRIEIPEDLTFTDEYGEEVTIKLTSIRGESTWGSGSEFSFKFWDVKGSPRTLVLPSTLEYVLPLNFVALDMSACGNSIPVLQTNGNDVSQYHIIPVVADDVMTSTATGLDSWEGFYTYSKSEFDNNGVAVEIDVDSPGRLPYIIDEKSIDVVNVANLVVKGTLNDEDMRAIPRFKNALRIDLSGASADIVYATDLHNLFEMKLPETVKTVAEHGFQRDYFLPTVTTTEVTAIGENAFEECYSVHTLEFPALETVGGNAFKYCNNLSTLVFSDKVKEIPNGMASYAKRLESFRFPNCVKTISSGAFQESGLKRAVIPEGCEGVYEWAFSGYSLEYMELPSSILYFGSYGGNMPNLKEVKCFMVAPTFDRFFEYIHPQATLYVAPFAFKEFFISEGHYGFYEVKSFDGEAKVLNVVRDFELETTKGLADKATVYVRNGANFTVSTSVNFGDMTFIDNNSNGNWTDNLTSNGFVAASGDITARQVEFAGKDFTVNEGVSFSCDSLYFIGRNLELRDGAIGGLSFSGMELTLNNANNFRSFEYTVNSTERYNENTWQNERFESSLISFADCQVGGSEIYKSFEPDRWNFFTLPMDEAYITAPEGALWVVREYDGAARANKETDADISTWKNVSGTLKGGKGYILHYTMKGDNQNDRAVFGFSSNAFADGMTRSGDATVLLEKYPSTEVHNKGWNLVGNPYPAYMVMNEENVSFNQPYTVWNGENYRAYSLVDDSYILKPFESFFVQALLDDADNNIVFRSVGRRHYTESLSDMMRAPRMNFGERTVLNLLIEGNGKSDRTRIALNEDASFEYEGNRDASKFMSMDATVPQLFSMSEDVRMAINERPLGDGTALLGVVIPADGEYTLSLDMRGNDNMKVELIDLLTGETADITADDYRFTAEVSTVNERFMLRFTKGASVDGVGDAENITVDGNTLSVSAETIAVYSLDGRIVDSGRGQLETVLEPGIYVVSADGVARKIAVGK